MGAGSLHLSVIVQLRRCWGTTDPLRQNVNKKIMDGQYNTQVSPC
jgi:hypothetical protein